MLRFWMQDSVEPRGAYDERAGRWAAEDAWPSPADRAAAPPTSPPAGLAPAAGDGDALAHSSPLTLGADAGSWLPYGNPADLPGDQRAEDAWSLCFDSAPLEAPLELLGIPRLRLRVAADRPLAFVVARLCDVAPDGTSALVTRGVLNLCHRHGHDRPEPLVPGEAVDVELPLKAIGYSVPPGHRLRLALSTSYWPWVWPSPEPVEVAVTCDAGSRLELPVRPPRPEDAELAPFAEPEISAPLAIEWLAERNPRWEIARDVVSGLAHDRHVARALGRQALPERASSTATATRCASPSARATRCRPTVECERTIRIGRGDEWQTRIEMRARMSADREDFHVSGDARRLRGRPPRALARPLLRASRATTADAVDARGYAAALEARLDAIVGADAAAGRRSTARPTSRAASTAGRRRRWPTRPARGRARRWPSSPSTGTGRCSTPTGRSATGRRCWCSAMPTRSGPPARRRAGRSASRADCSRARASAT